MLDYIYIRPPDKRCVIAHMGYFSYARRLVSFYNSFGEYDLLVIYEAPDETSAAAIVLAAVSPGHLRKVKTTVLLSAQEGMEAMRKAGEATYRAPGQQ